MNAKAKQRRREREAIRDEARARSHGQMFLFISPIGDALRKAERDKKERAVK